MYSRTVCTFSYLTTGVKFANYQIQVIFLTCALTLEEMEEGHDYEVIAPDQEGRGEYSNDATASFQATINRLASRRSRIPSSTMFDVVELTMPDALMRY